MVGSGHHRLEAVRADRFRNRVRVGCDDHAAEPAFRCALGDVDDHRPPAMSARGLPGRRVEAMRAGIRMSVDIGGWNRV